MINNLEEKFNLSQLYLNDLETVDDSINILKNLFKNKYNDYDIGLWILENITDSTYISEKDWESGNFYKKIFRTLLKRYDNDIEKLNNIKKIGYHQLVWRPSHFNLNMNDLDKYQKDYKLLLGNKDFLQKNKVDFFMFNAFSDAHNLKMCKYLIPEEFVNEFRQTPLNLYNNKHKKIAFLFSPKERTPSFNSFTNILKYLSRIDNNIILYVDNVEEELSIYQKDCIKNLKINYIRDLDDDTLFNSMVNENIDIIVSMYGHYKRYNILLRKPCKITVSGYEGGMVFPKYFIDYNMLYKNNILKNDDHYNFIYLDDIFPVLKKTDFKLSYKKRQTPIFNSKKIKIGLITTDLKLSKDLINFIIKLLKNENILLTIYSFVKKEYFQKIVGISDKNRLLITTYNNDNNYDLKKNLFYIDTFIYNNHSTAKEILGSYRPMISFFNKEYLCGMYSKTLIDQLNMNKELCRDNIKDYYDLVMKYVNSEKEYYKMYDKFIKNLEKSGLIDNKKYSKNFYKILDDIKIDKNKYDAVNNNLDKDIEIINNLDLINYNVYNNNFKSSIIISFSVLPTRLLHKDFENCLIYLLEQVVKPKYIIVNYCDNYKRKINYDKNKFIKKISYYKNKYHNKIIFNKSIDYGPITKALGLIHLKDNIKKNINDNDKIIVIDDDWKYNKLMTYYYELCYSLYQCDAIFIDEKKIINWGEKMEVISKKNIFYDNYSGIAYGWLSFSFRYKYLNKLMDIYNELLEMDENIFCHDDLSFTIFYKKLKLYSCGMNLFFTIMDSRLLDYVDGLRLENNCYDIRMNLEKKFLKLNNIEFNEEKNTLNIIEKNEYNNNFIIDQLIDNRKILFNISEIEYDPNENNYKEYHYDLKYINSNILLLTFTNFSEDNNEDIKFKFNYKDKNAVLNIKNDNYYSKKISFFIKLKFNITLIKHLNIEEKIIQTYETNNISRNKFYSICTILNNLPNYKYIFYNNLDIINFINEYYPNIISLYNKINCGAYKADLFRVLYLYKNGGVYFDCKNILYSNLKYILCDNEVYVRDLNNGIYNGFIYIKYPNNEIIKKYLLEILYNFYKNKYFENNDYGCLEICGPLCFSKLITNEKNIKLFNNIIDNSWKDSLLLDYHEKKIIIKNSYYNYYNENNYLNTKHYVVIWKDKKIYNDLIINYDKINYISSIVWINLDRSIDRRNNMKKLLKKINIPNYRISAIDGKKYDIRNFIKGKTLEKNMSNYEIACTLSHIKAITFLSKLKGNYFMVCEDDIEIRNINFIKDDLKSIIKNCPKFDILILHKIYIRTLNKDYLKWNNYINEFGKDYHIAGTSCYIISRSGINKILNISKYKDFNNFLYDKSFKFDLADFFLYKNVISYVYKYNYFSVSGKDSTIHNDHINHHNYCEDIQDKWILNNCL